MANKTDRNTSGTSFHGVRITASPNELIQILGEPTEDSNGHGYETNLEWDCETDLGDVFSIYDRNHHRRIMPDEKIEWHIGAHSLAIAFEAKGEIVKQTT